MFKKIQIGFLDTIAVNSSASYISGQLLSINSSGEAVKATDANRDSIIGIAQNDSSVDVPNGLAAFVHGMGRYKIYATDPTDDDTIPFDKTLTFDEGELLYVAATTGLVTNVLPTGQKPFGVVVAVSGTGASQVIEFLSKV